MKILFCTDYFPHAVEMLQLHLPEDEVAPAPPGQVYRHLKDADVIIPAMHRVDASVLGNTSARMVHQYGVGLEGVDIKAATSRGIYVANVPGSLASSNGVSVAEHAVFLMLALARRYPQAAESVRLKKLGTPIGIALGGKTALVIGLGTIGSALATRLKAFEMWVLGIKRRPSLEVKDKLDLDFCGGPKDLHKALSKADFTVLATPVTEETRGLIGGAEFQAMKAGAFLVNVARGPLIQHDPLVDALKSGKLAGVGLDVFWDEPFDPEDEVFNYNVIATPHVAGVTDASYKELAKGVADNVQRLKQGLPPLNCVNLHKIIELRPTKRW